MLPVGMFVYKVNKSRKTFLWLRQSDSGKHNERSYEHWRRAKHVGVSFQNSDTISHRLNHCLLSYRLVVSVHKWRFFNIRSQFRLHIYMNHVCWHSWAIISNDKTNNDYSLEHLFYQQNACISVESVCEVRWLHLHGKTDWRPRRGAV